jgi:hypothetical protein
MHSLHTTGPVMYRELQNLIERPVIRSDDGVLPNPLPHRRIQFPRLPHRAHCTNTKQL